jgi:hypothetical protein
MVSWKDEGCTAGMDKVVYLYDWLGEKPGRVTAFSLMCLSRARADLSFVRE